MERQLGKRNLCMPLAGLVVGGIAIAYLLSAAPHTYARMGLSVYEQLIAHRVATSVVFLLLATLLVSSARLTIELSIGQHSWRFFGWLRILFVCILPLVLTWATLQTPFWSRIPPLDWDRPMLLYGWPIPVQGEWRCGVSILAIPVNWVLWTFYLMFALGCRKVRQYLLALVIDAIVCLACTVPACIVMP